MSKTISFEVPNELYEVFEREAAQTGRAVEAVAIEFMAKYGPKPRPKLSEEELREAREKFRRHIGAASLGHPTGADNESIDADLAREYASTHEEE
ncbi:MAG TPA: hypothetical protein VJZ26_02195 [Blastocatellia bacterium]|nr:hypothetical protein [Blastocatellia bacterium]